MVSSLSHQPAYIGGGPPRLVVAGVASQLICGPRETRKGIVICNDSDTVVYVARSETAILNAGIRLNANGGTLVDKPDSLGRIYTGPWSVICCVATKNVAFSEDF